MTLTRYIYKGPRSAASLRVPGGLLDVQLIPGKAVDLPGEHDYTQVLLALDHLVLAPVQADTTAPVAKKGGKA